MPSASRSRAEGAPTSSSSDGPDLLHLSRSVCDQTRLIAALPPKRIHPQGYHEPLLLSPAAHSTATSAGSSRVSKNGSQIGAELLRWYADVAQARGMPWRQSWIQPDQERYTATEEGRLELRRMLERRAYEVWISEIMLQQTRVATVIDYWNSWVSRWPTIQALAAASPEDVLSAWKGLGYYSRATRIHQAARAVVADPELDGLLPSTAHDLEKKVAGVGRYTAGAISSIVFGRAEAIVDGNVSRVLARQLALYANPKSKATTDFLWVVAQRLVEAVAGEGKDHQSGVSEVPGLWNQALMELGSTICTPVPNCSSCPIRASCRAYAEGERLAVSNGSLNRMEALHPQPPLPHSGVLAADIEDICEMCEPFALATHGNEGSALEKNSDDLRASEADTSDGKRKTAPPIARCTRKITNAQQSSLLSHFKRNPSATSLNLDCSSALLTRDEEASSAFISTGLSKSQGRQSQQAEDTIVSYVKRFPLKVIRAQVREEECIVCIIEKRSSKGSSPLYLMEQRPEKGLLASLWEFPTLTLQSVETDDVAAPPSLSQRSKAHRNLANDFVRDLLEQTAPAEQAKHQSILGSKAHLFSHLKLLMNVHHFIVHPLKDSVAKGVNVDTFAAPVAKGRKPNRHWYNAEELEAENMGTGMKRCWELLALGECERTGAEASAAKVVKKVKRSK